MLIFNSKPYSRIVQSNAKLNLSLKIGDYNSKIGLHSIESTMIEIPYFETIEYIIQFTNNTKTFEYVQKNPEQKCKINEKSTIYKAAKLWFDTKISKLGTGLKLTVNDNNNVPCGKGFGIGSSNAACTLKVLEDAAKEHLNLPYLKKIELNRIAFKIGSDVPFFVFGNGYAEVGGCGEIVTPILKKPKILHWLLAIPQRDNLTQNAYSRLYQNNKRVYSNFEDLKENLEFKQILVKKTGIQSWHLTGSGSAFWTEGACDKSEELNRIQYFKTSSDKCNFIYI